MATYTLINGVRVYHDAIDKKKMKAENPAMYEIIFNEKVKTKKTNKK